ncbi:MAG TPA: proline--tRNA ligase [Chthoniobacterales bacterium]|nr:proline--tRNA ligase [Chthoniobacterales bacterium]
MTKTPEQKTAITPRRDQDFPEWYQQVVRAAELAESSDVRGCMVIRPWGYGIWENMQHQLDAMFRATGHRNAYFPLFIPLSYFAKEAEHVEGFAKECAVVTHTRLEADAEGKLKPGSPLNEPLVVRPTSETIIGASYAKWVQSYRDLPILLNQWANIVRWEMRPRLFLRTAEFLWQEGHTVHETEAEAREETERMLNVYATFAEEFCAIPVVKGKKSESEKFPGAVDTLSIEAMVQDRKAIQAGTSHFLGQNFAKASGIQFQNREGKQEFGWTTSWGMTTRMVGTVVMMHSDDDGLVLPPRIAPTQIVILPITPKEETRAKVLETCDALALQLRGKQFGGAPLEVEVDKRDLGGGVKNWEWIKKGVPVRIEIGPRDLEKNSGMVSRRDQPLQSKQSMSLQEFAATAPEMLMSIQQNLFDRAKTFQQENTRVIESKEQFYDFFTAKNPSKPEIHGGFALAHWNGSRQVEEQIKNDLKVTIRVIPFDGEPGKCIFTGEPSPKRVIWAKSY